MSERTERTKSLIKSIADADAAERQAQGRSDVPVGTSGNPSTQVLTVANVITFCRLALTIVFLFIARRTQTVSWLGKIMDPIMDRVLLFTGVLGLLIVGELPVWVPVFVIGRDLYLAAGGLILQHYRRRPVDVAYVGKAATALLMFGFCDLLLGLPEISGLGLIDVPWLPGLNAQPSAVGILFVYAGVVCSLITAIVYTAEGVRIIRSSRGEKDGAL